MGTSVTGPLKLKIKLGGKFVTGSRAPSIVADAVPQPAGSLASITTLDMLKHMGVDGLPAGQALMPALPEEWASLKGKMQAQAQAKHASQMRRPAEPCGSAETELRRALGGYKSSQAKVRVDKSDRPAWGASKPPANASQVAAARNSQGVLKKKSPSPPADAPTAKGPLPAVAANTKSNGLSKKKLSQPAVPAGHNRDTAMAEQPVQNMPATAHHKKAVSVLDTAQPMQRMPSAAAAPRHSQSKTQGKSDQQAKSVQELQGPKAVTAPPKRQQKLAVPTDPKPQACDSNTAPATAAPGLKRIRKASPTPVVEPEKAIQSVQPFKTAQLLVPDSAAEKTQTLTTSPQEQAAKVVVPAARVQATESAKTAADSVAAAAKTTSTVTEDGLATEPHAQSEPTAEPMLLDMPLEKQNNDVATVTALPDASSDYAIIASKVSNPTVPAAVGAPLKSVAVAPAVTPAAVHGPEVQPGKQLATAANMPTNSEAGLQPEDKLYQRPAQATSSATALNSTAPLDTGVSNAAQMQQPTTGTQRGSTTVRGKASDTAAPAAKPNQKIVRHTADGTAAVANSGGLAVMVDAAAHEDTFVSNARDAMDVDPPSVSTSLPAGTSSPGLAQPGAVGPFANALAQAQTPTAAADLSGSVPTPAAGKTSDVVPSIGNTVKPADTNGPNQPAEASVIEHGSRSALQADGKADSTAQAAAVTPSSTDASTVAAAGANTKHRDTAAQSSAAEGSQTVDDAKPASKPLAHTSKAKQSDKPAKADKGSTAKPAVKPDTSKVTAASAVKPNTSTVTAASADIPVDLPKSTAKAIGSKVVQASALADSPHAGATEGVQLDKPKETTASGVVRPHPLADAKPMPQAPKFVAPSKLTGALPQKGLVWQKGLKSKPMPGTSGKPKTSPAKLSLAQAAEAELAKVAQDHAPAASGAVASQAVPGMSTASDRSKRQDDRDTASRHDTHKRSSNTDRSRSQHRSRSHRRSYSRSLSYSTSRSRSPSRAARRQSYSRRSRSPSMDRRDAGQRHSNRSKHDHRSVSRHDSRQQKTSQRHRDGDRHREKDRNGERHRDKDRDRARSRDQSNPGQHAERYLQRQAVKAAERRSEKKSDKSGKREARDKEELPVVDGVILSPENVARAQQGRQVKNVKGQWVDSNGLLTGGRPAPSQSLSPSPALEPSDDLPPAPALSKQASQPRTTSLQTLPSASPKPYIRQEGTAPAAAGPGTAGPAGMKEAGAGSMGKAPSTLDHQTASGALPVASHAYNESSAAAAPQPADAVQVPAPVDMDVETAQPPVVRQRDTRQPDGEPAQPSLFTTAAVASAALTVDATQQAASTTSMSAVTVPSTTTGPAVTTTAPAVLSPVPQLNPLPPLPAAQQAEYLQQWQQMYAADQQQQQLYAMQHGGYAYPGQQFMPGMGFGGVLSAEGALGVAPYLPMGGGMSVPGPMPPAGVPPPRPPPLGPNSPPPKMPLAPIMSSHANPLYTAPNGSTAPDAAAASTAQAAHRDQVASGMPVSAAQQAGDRQNASRQTTGRYNADGQAADRQTADRQGSGLLNRQGSKDLPKTGNRVRRTDGLEARLAERDVASSSGLPARETSSGDSARGGQNGAAPHQGRTSLKRPSANQPRPSSKPVVGQLGKIKSKSAAAEEEEPPVKGRMQRIAERLEKQERDRLEKGASNTSGEIARTGSATGASGQEPGALAGKGPSRLGPGRTNSSNLVAEQPAGNGNKAGKPNRKRALQTEAEASGSGSQGSRSSPGQELASPLKKRKGDASSRPADASVVPTMDLSSKLAMILDHFSNPDKQKLLTESPVKLAAKAAKLLHKASACARDAEGHLGADAVRWALQACVVYLHQAALLEQPQALGVNTKLIAALDNAIETCELTLRLQSRVTGGNSLQRAGITLLLQKLLTAALQHRAEAERLLVASAQAHVQLAMQEGLQLSGKLAAQSGPSGSLRRVSQGRGTPVPADYVQQDWQLLQASIQRNQRMAELSSSLSKSAMQVMSLAGSVMNGAAHERQEVQLNLMALNMVISGSSIDLIHMALRAMLSMYRLT